MASVCGREGQQVMAARDIIQAAAGAAGATDSVYVEDVFSTSFTLVMAAHRRLPMVSTWLLRVGWFGVKIGLHLEIMFFQIQFVVAIQLYLPIKQMLLLDHFI